MVDIVKTRAQLKERAGKLLALIEPGEALSTEDDATLDSLIDPLLAQLAAGDIVYVADSETIELEVFLPLARLLANAAGPDFGSPINEEAKQSDEAELRKILATKPTYEPLRGEYY
jgi:hypothetical protein